MTDAGAAQPRAAADRLSSIPVKTLELALPPGAVPRLLRHPTLALPSPGPEGAAFACTWHDTPDHTLAAEGRTLCESASGWLLEEVRAVKRTASAPGTAARVIRSAATLDGLGLALAAPARPVASFVGSLYRAASGPCTVEILEGRVEAGGTGHPVCRVRLDGFSPAEAAALAEALPVSVPEEPLPALALRTATGGTLVEPGRVHVVGGSVESLAGAALAGLAAAVAFWCGRAAHAGAEGPEAIHQARVSVRRLRSLLRLLRPAVSCPDLHAVEAELRAAFDKLGAVRDLDVFLQGCAAEVAAALPDEPRVTALFAAAGARRTRAWSEAQRWLASPRWRAALVRLAATAALRPWAEAAVEERRRLLDEDAAQYGARVLRRARRKVLSAGPPGELADDALHALRRRCKRLRYAAEVCAPLFPQKPAKRFVRRLARVQDAMGRINDGGVATRLASEVGRSRTFANGAVVGWTAAEGRGARRELAREWKRFRAAEPFWD